tara:strand:- start:2065 stop:2313 length:249 start_codon:yes stop_codon:yes gene_type:complete
MAHKGANVKVTAKECRGNHERMIRRFTKKVKKEKIIEEYKERRYYTKPSVKRKEKRLKAIRLRRREALKRLKAQERRNRKKR